MPGSRPLAGRACSCCSGPDASYLIDRWFGSVFEAFQTFLSFFQGSLLALLLLGMLWRRTTQWGGLAGHAGRCRHRSRRAVSSTPARPRRKHVLSVGRLVVVCRGHGQSPSSSVCAPRLSANNSFAVWSAGFHLRNRIHERACLFILCRTAHTCLCRDPTLETTSKGKWVFVAALGLLLIWLIVMPRRLIGQSKQVPPWWKNVRVWAIVICVVQLWVYWQFG